MKKLIIVNGPMGVGKSSVCKRLNSRLPKSVWLEGDWCWMMDPFIVDDENKAMVIDNISHILRNYLKNSNFQNVILSWVIHKDEILNEILDKIALDNYELKKITLVCSRNVLKKRVSKDIASGKRDVESLERSLAYLKYYEEFVDNKLDTSEKGKSEVVDEIIKIIE